MEDDDYRWDGAWNSWQFIPALLHEDAITLTNYAETLGYKLRTRDVGYTLEEVKETLRVRGPSAFLNRFRIQEDISPKAPQPTVEQFITQRLAVLNPESELIVVDPFLFPTVRDLNAYSGLASRVILTALGNATHLVTVVNGRSSDVTQGAVEQALRAHRPDLSLTVHRSEDFHDRFWIGDRTRGAVVGTSLNGLGGRIFLMDELNPSDLATVLAELATRGFTPDR